MSAVAFVRTDDLVVLVLSRPCPAPHDAAFSPSGDRVAVACALSGEVVILDGHDFHELERVDLTTDTGVPRVLNAEWAPDGTRLLVTLADRDEVVALTPGTGAAVARFSTGSGPAQLAISPDGSTVVVANRRASRRLRTIPWRWPPFWRVSLARTAFRPNM